MWEGWRVLGWEGGWDELGVGDVGVGVVVRFVFLRE